MHMVTSQILKSMNFTKTEKSRYLENETLFFLPIKNQQLHIMGYFIAKNSFVTEVTICTVGPMVFLRQNIGYT